MATEQQEATRRVLLVEDEYFIAADMARAFAARGVEVVGPVGNLDEAMQVIDVEDRLDGAVLDINLHGVPFVFATGYDGSMIPERFADVTRCEKPIEARKVARALFG
jgi:ActR/RegA family two-component response regulator